MPGSIAWWLSSSAAGSCVVVALIACVHAGEALARAIGAGTKTDTFDFLGFKHICARSRRGKFTVHVRTMKKRLRRSFNGVAEWCRVHRHDDVSKQQATLNAKLRGHYRYYGRPTNYHSLWQFYRGVRCVWKKWLVTGSVRGEDPVDPLLLGAATIAQRHSPRLAAECINACWRGFPCLTVGLPPNLPGVSSAFVEII